MKNRLKEIMEEQGGWGVGELTGHLQEHGLDITEAVIRGIYHNKTQSIRYDVLGAILDFYNIQPNDFFKEVK